MPFDAYHRDDQPAEVRAATGDVAPVVVAETTAGIVNLLAPADLEPRVTAGLAATGLPTALDPWLRPEVLARVAVDKKRTGGQLAFIACAAPGDCQVVDLPTTAIADLLRP